MRIAILAPGYPSQALPYNYAFVHARAALYAARGEQVAAFALGAGTAYELDGIEVVTGPASALAEAIAKFDPEVVAFHAPNFRTIPIVRRLGCRCVVWVHGHEAIFNFQSVTFARNLPEKVAKWMKVVPRNLVQLTLLRRFLAAQRSIVFVSDWIRRAAEKNTLQRYPGAQTVPNPVDTDLFTYRVESARRFEGVTTRSLNSKKRGIDVAIRAFAGLEEASLTIYGRGALADGYQRLIRRTGSNAELEQTYVPHRQMPQLFGAYGFFLAPSRAETQGVAMCEAMACGLPVVATRVGGIPEFVDDGVEGFLVPTEDPDAMREAVRDLVSDPVRFEAMSHAARQRIERQCAGRVIAERELALLRET